jgi:hypothetical protein
MTDFWSAGLLLVLPQEPCNNNTGAVVALPESQAHGKCAHSWIVGRRIAFSFCARRTWYMMIPELLAEELHSLVLGTWLMMIPELLAEELHCLVLGTLAHDDS